jgi:2-polyprenyl-3-methyl-5-hydroxy-6-metoxy-1,4-benzoquinol methylase
MQWGHVLLALVLGPWSNWPAMSYQRVSYRKRLQAVQDHFAASLAEAEPGPVRVVSICAGDGRDVMGVLESHARREDVNAWLVELDRKSVEAGIKRRDATGLSKLVTFLHADATDFATFKNILPCDIVMVCGVWGHVPPAERLSLVKALGKFCKPGGTVVWSRGVDRGRSRFTDIQALFEHNSFERVSESITPDDKWAICTHRYMGRPVEVPTSGRIFNFQRKSGR